MRLTIGQLQEDIIREFEEFDDWVDRYTYIMSYSSQLHKMDPTEKTDELLFKDCVSKVWLKMEYQENHFLFYADSDSIILRGTLALLQKVLYNKTGQEISENDIFFLKEIGMEENMPETRTKGMKAVISAIRQYIREQV